MALERNRRLNPGCDDPGRQLMHKMGGPAPICLILGDLHTPNQDFVLYRVLTLHDTGRILALFPGRERGYLKIF